MRKDFLTPPTAGTGETCRTLRTPADKEWLGVFNSALLTLLDKWRWEQVNLTDLTIDQAVAQAQAILDEFWASSECFTCTQPDGTPFFRITAGGVIEQLTMDGWSFPEGDYELPPIPPRTGGTDIDKRCLAAANAANVWQQMYENITDSQSANLTLAEAIVEFILFVAAILLAPFSAIIAAILAVAAILFNVVFETAEFVTADYWSSDFDEKLKCALYECAEVDGAGVVTFDFDCFNEKLANKVVLTTDYFELLLFGQLQAMLMYIGGDGLNAMGATTEITEAFCSVCDGVWCYVAVFENTLDVYEFYPTGACPGGSIQAAYLQSVACYVAPATYNFFLLKNTFAARTITFAEAKFDYGRGDFSNYPPNGVQNVKMTFFLLGAQVAQVTYGNGSNQAGVYLQYGGDIVADEVRLTGIMCDRVTGSNNGYLRVYHILLAGEGENPIGETNCTDPS